MYRENGKRKNKRYETKPYVRLKATVVSMTATLYAANHDFQTNPLKSDSNPAHPRSAIRPAARPAPTGPVRLSPGTSSRIHPPGDEKLSYNKGLPQAYSASRPGVNDTL